MWPSVLKETASLLSSLMPSSTAADQCRCTPPYGQEEEEAGREERDLDTDGRMTVQDWFPAQVVKDEKSRQAQVEKEKDTLDEKRLREAVHEKQNEDLYEREGRRRFSGPMVSSRRRRLVLGPGSVLVANAPSNYVDIIEKLAEVLLKFLEAVGDGVVTRILTLRKNICVVI